MRTLTVAATVVIGLLFSFTPAEANADRELRQRIGEAMNLLKRNPDEVDETVAAIEALEGMLKHDMAIELLAFFDECDQSWDAAIGNDAVPGAGKRGCLQEMRCWKLCGAWTTRKRSSSLKSRSTTTKSTPCARAWPCWMPSPATPLKAKNALNC